MKKLLAILLLCASNLAAQGTGLPNDAPQLPSNLYTTPPANSGGGLAFVASLPATCTPGVTASVQLSVTAYTINYCSATNTWTALGAGGGLSGLTVNGILYGATSSTVASPTPPTVNGSYTCGYTVTASAAVAPTCPLIGLVPDALAGANVLYSDNNSVIYNPPAALTLPALATLGNPNFFTVLINNANAVTLTPTTPLNIALNGAAAGTSQAAASLLRHTKCALAVDQVASNQVDVDCVDVAGYINGTAFAGTSGHLVSFGAANIPADSGVVAANAVVASSPGAGVAHFAGSTQTVTSSAIVGADMTNATVTATQLAAQYSKGSCTEVWGGSGTSFAMQAGDDAISNNSCYNDSGVTRTITALKCRSDNAGNTTVLTPTFGSAGTGTAILTGTVTCGNSYAYSATGTLNNTAWTTGTGIDPGMSTVGNATSIAMIVEFTF